MKHLFLMTFLLASWLAIRVQAAPDDFNANTEKAAAVLQQWQNRHYLWHTTGWWNAANCVEAMENVIEADNGQKYSTTLERTFQANRSHHYLNKYYDDEGWWALAWIRAYDLTGQPQYLDMAKTIFTDLKTGWTDHCDGGLIWSKIHFYKNAIPNELFLLTAIRLHQRTPHDDGPDSYLNEALKEWGWFKRSGMINSQNLINDGLGQQCENNGGTTWTYNQGVIIGGLTDLYKSTGDTDYLNQATAIADAAISTLVDEKGVLQEPCEDRGCGGGDVPQFKGIFIRYLAYLYDETRNPAYLKFLCQNAQSVWANDRDAAGHLGLKWSGPFDQADAARQSSAMMAVSALAEPMTRHLPFIRGAGSPTFYHETGQPTGVLSWTCNERDAAGLALSGTCTLAGAVHLAHFRLAVDEIHPTPDALAQLEIKDEAGNLLASRPVLGGSFRETNASQDFDLAFTNLASDHPLTVGVHWNHAANAPHLTISDVSLDGGDNWTAANLDHDLGRLDGLNGWEADPVRDHASGNLVNGPAQVFSAGKQVAAFELKVDHFNRDESEVATLSVVEADSGRLVATRSVTENEFPNTLYQVFALKFTAEAGRHYRFCTYWHYAPEAPRLTQRSLMLRPAGFDF
jgi:predicted alpha-1,6-mannanase (GH76 family)